MDASGDNGGAAHGSWKEWGRHVLKRLESNDSAHSSLYRRLDGTDEKVNERLGKLEGKVMVLNAKAAGWGALGAMVPIVVVLAVKWITAK